jgi:hypothetical protein
VVTLLVNLPFALAAPAAWAWFARYNTARSAENSIWEALGVRSPLALDAATLALVLFAALFAGACAFRAREEERERAVRLGTALVLVVWIATNKVYSPQYALYAFAAGALASAPAWTFFALSAIAAIDYHLAFEVRSGRRLFVFFDGTYYAEEVVRTLAYLALCAVLVRAMRAASRKRVAVAAADPSGAG